MKRIFVFSFSLVMLALVAVSCGSSEKCPAYSQVENVPTQHS